ncbi:MAG: alpha-L-fucosidase [Chitinophagaceae bacterium]
MKTVRGIVLFALMALCWIPATAQEACQANWESLKKYEIPEWFRDAKFGIFIHWGVYAVPAYGGGGIFGEWYGNDMYQIGSAAYKHHLATYGPKNKFGYKDFIPMFKAEKFDPDAWAKLFKDAGAKYVVPVAEHHDGFAMYNTSMSKWNSVEMGPHRDIIEELSKSIRKEGMIFGLSSHRAEHWYFFHNGRLIKSDVNNPEYEDYYGPAAGGEDSLETTKIGTEFLNDWLLRNVELVNKYHPQVFWFDWWLDNPSFKPYLKSFASHYYNTAKTWDKEVVLNYKNNAFPDSAAVLDMEREGQPGIRALAWQSDDALGNRSWGYIEGDHYKTPQFLVTELIDIVSKNGNLLLNVGPKADGTIPPEQADLLLAMGKWLGVNGEAIYGTRPWKVFGEGPVVTEIVDQANKRPDQALTKTVSFTSADIRFTMKGNIVYAMPLAIPSGKISISSLSSKNQDLKIASVELVGSIEKINWSQQPDGLIIQAPKQYPSAYAPAFKIRFKTE